MSGDESRSCSGKVEVAGTFQVGFRDPSQLLTVVFQAERPNRMVPLKRCNWSAVKICFYPTSVGMIFLAFFTVKVFLSTTSIRPSADDYCAASGVLQSGIIGSAWSSYQSWSGDVLLILLNNVLVGAPLAYLPLWFSAVVPQVLSIVLFGAVIAKSIEHCGRRRWLVAASFAPVSWVGFWWLQSSWSVVEVYPEHQHMVTSWQTVSVSYVIAPLIAILFTLVVVDRLFYPKQAQDEFFFSKRVWLSLFSLIIGLMGLTLSLTWLVLILTLSLMQRLQFLVTPRDVPILRLAIPPWFLSFGISWWSPGLQQRRDFLEALESAPVQGWSVDTVVNWWLLPTIRSWLTSAVSPSFLFALTIGFLVASGFVLQVGPGRSSFQKKSGLIGVLLLALSLISAALARLGQASTYEAQWHFIPSRTFLLVSAIYFGVCAGVGISGKIGKANSNAWWALALLVVTVLAVIPSQDSRKESIQNRLSLWIEGPARASASIGDIEGDWINACWNDVQLLSGKERQ